jgi:hypothetical protein
MGIVTANAVSQSLFSTNIGQFLTEGWDGKAEAHSWELTLAELLGVVTNMGVYGPTSKKWTGDADAGGAFVAKAIKRNIRKEAPVAVGSVITAMLVNGGMKKFGAYRRLNRVVRQVGLGKVIKFS